jgi:hypothetical protein
MKIGKLELELVKPEELDRQLLALTGCSAAEVFLQLEQAAIASSVASALRPFLQDPPPPAELAQAIADEGVVAVRALVRQLYADELGIEPPEMPEHLVAAAEAEAAARADESELEPVPQTREGPKPRAKK